MVVLLTSNFVNASEQTRHGSFPDMPGSEFVVLEDHASSNKDVVYYLHGGNSNAQSLFNPFNEALRAEWKRLGVAAPRMISISLGPIWLLMPTTSSPHSGKLELVLDGILPMLERELFDGNVHRRFLIGSSMGGFNALQLMTADPSRFDRVALVAPAVLPLSPFATEAEIKDFVQRTGAPETLDAGGFGVREILALGRGYVPTASEWAEASALERLEASESCGQRMVGSPLPPVLIQYANQDHRFAEGARRVISVLKTRGTSVTVDVRPGDHADVDGRAVASFLR